MAESEFKESVDRIAKAGAEEQNYTRLSTNLIEAKEKANGACKHIVFDSIKGGPGKSTLSLNTAVALSYNYKVLFVDMDTRQATTSRVLAIRNEDIKTLREEGNKEELARLGNTITLVKNFIPSEDNVAVLLNKAAGHFDYVIYDMPGFTSSTSVRIGVISDLIISPLNADWYSFASLGTLKFLIKNINDERERLGGQSKRVLVILNNLQTAANSILVRQAKEQLDQDESGLFYKVAGVEGGIKQYAAFKHAVAIFRGVTEVNPSTDRSVSQLNKLVKAIIKLAG